MDLSKLICGKKLARNVTNQLKIDVEDMKRFIPNFKPGLAIVQVGDREDSNVYIRMKIKKAEEIGIAVQNIRLLKTITQNQLLNEIKKLNNSEDIHGIIVQMPLDTDNVIDNNLITNSVDPNKDVDGLHTMNEGKIATGDLSGFIPCTPHGVIKLIESTGVQISGLKAVVVGRSRIVGSPTAELLKWKNATVTICHSRTTNLAQECKTADILVAAIGKPEFIRGEWIKPGAIVIDCGITSVKDNNSGRNSKRLVGDVHFDSAIKVISFITPVPGGVGPMTVAMLMSNTVNSAKNFLKMRLIPKISNEWNLKRLEINPKYPVPSDIEISNSQKPRNIKILAQEIGLNEDEITMYGNKKAKVSLSVLERLKNRNSGKYIIVTGVTPTSNGEGKSTITIGLAQSLTVHRKLNTIACIRQASQGPTFGIKGGAAGGGYSQVIPMDELNLHLTGDIHAITSANNLLAAQIDARIFHEKTQTDKALFKRLTTTSTGERFTNIQLRRLKKLDIPLDLKPSQLTDKEAVRFSRLNIDTNAIVWKRVIDTNDRFLREIQIGRSPTEKNMVRDTGFKITVASEIMASLALAQDYKDLEYRISNMVVAFDESGNEITADDLGATGAIMVLIKDVLEPNLMQTLEGSPVLVHTGPFANIAHGCSSIIADKIALKLVGSQGYVITEAGFGSDIGLEKFINIKCRISGLMPNVIVLVTTVRALKMHGESPNINSQTDSQLLLKNGIRNLEKHISNCLKYGPPVIVAINKHTNDNDQDLELIRQVSFANGAFGAVICQNWSTGGFGATDLADQIILACQTPSISKFLYTLDQTIEEKIKTIAIEMYGANNVVYSDTVLKIIRKYQDMGYGKLPICMAKTPFSLTDNPEIKGTPTGFSIHIKDMFLSKGAGFIVAVTGEIAQMPGLPTRPAIYDIELNLQNMQITGLF